MAPPSNIADKDVERVNAVEDLRDAETIRATSHLVSFRLDRQPETEAEEKVELPKLALPKTLKETHAMLAEAQALPGATKTDAAIKRFKIESILAHLHSLSQGPAAPVMTAQNSRALSEITSNLADDMQAEQLAKQYRVVRKLLEENKALTAEIELLKTPKK